MYLQPRVYDVERRARDRVLAGRDDHLVVFGRAVDGIGKRTGLLLGAVDPGRVRSRIPLHRLRTRRDCQQRRTEDHSKGQPHRVDRTVL